MEEEGIAALSLLAGCVVFLHQGIPRKIAGQFSQVRHLHVHVHTMYIHMPTQHRKYFVTANPSSYMYTARPTVHAVNIAHIAAQLVEHLAIECYRMLELWLNATPVILSFSNFPSLPCCTTHGHGHVHVHAYNTVHMHVHVHVIHALKRRQ